ncbi:hypothetical protein B0H14DRAFT_2572113 [Mycena olivaceomarginata]|nr:hypothetical protein B0H14DRAFT_2572113 [Mycena olivaceomarginata]
MSYREVRPQIPSSDESGDDNLPNSRHSSTSLCDNDIVSGLRAYPARREHDIHIIGPELSSDENVDCLSLLKQNPHNDDGNYAVVLNSPSNEEGSSSLAPEEDGDLGDGGDPGDGAPHSEDDGDGDHDSPRRTMADTQGKYIDEVPQSPKVEDNSYCDGDVAGSESTMRAPWALNDERDSAEQEDNTQGYDLSHGLSCRDLSTSSSPLF